MARSGVPAKGKLVVGLQGRSYTVTVWPGFEVSHHVDRGWLHTPRGSFRYDEIDWAKLNGEYVIGAKPEKEES